MSLQCIVLFLLLHRSAVVKWAPPPKQLIGQCGSRDENSTGETNSDRDQWFENIRRSIKSDAVNVVQSYQFTETEVQFTSLPFIQIKPSTGSAFDQCTKQASVALAQELQSFITARRISHALCIQSPSRYEQRFCTTVSLTASLLLDSASKNSLILLVSLSDFLILCISCTGLVKALHNCDSDSICCFPA
ncbi:hypothetical protein Q1695_004822 [Nippostrongylus brasiliensis]|nr:hypothetical protein Q1695_004822 [Nippostrongylus brasiliensis]